MTIFFAVLVWFHSSGRAFKELGTERAWSKMKMERPWMKNTCWIINWAVFLAVGSLGRRVKFSLSVPHHILHLYFDVCTWSACIQQVQHQPPPGIVSASLAFFQVFHLSVSPLATDCSPSHLQLNDWSALVFLLSGHRYSHCQTVKHTCLTFCLSPLNVLYVQYILVHLRWYPFLILSHCTSADPLTSICCLIFVLGFFRNATNPFKGWQVCL